MRMNVDLELADIGTMIQAHNEQHPDHGTNCSCMDRHIRGARNIIQAFTPDVQRRLSYVLQAATRN